MRKSTAAVVSVAWGVAAGGTFACLLPYLLEPTLARKFGAEYKGYRRARACLGSPTASMDARSADRTGELFDRLRHHLDDGQIVELTHHIALENMRGRFNLALGTGPAGSATAWCAPSLRCIHEQGHRPEPRQVNSPLATSAVRGRTPGPPQEQSALGRP